MAIEQEDDLEESLDTEVEQESGSGEEGRREERDDGLKITTGEDGETIVEKGLSRRERRRQAHERQLDERISRSLSPIQQQNEELRRQLSTLMEHVTRQAAQPRREERSSSDDDVDEELLNTAREQKKIIEKIRTAQDPDKLEALERQWHALNQRAIDVRAAKIVDARLKTYQPPAGESEHERHLKEEFSDVFSAGGGDDAWARFTLLQRRALREAARVASSTGRPPAPVDFRPLHRQALEETAIELGLRRPKRPAPSNATRAKLSGHGGTNGDQRLGVRKLSQAERRMALAADGREISDEQKIADYVRRMEAEERDEG